MLRVKAEGAAREAALASASLQWSPQAALTVVMAAEGYPGSYCKGSVIRGLEQVRDAKVCPVLIVLQCRRERCLSLSLPHTCSSHKTTLTSHIPRVWGDRPLL